MTGQELPALNMPRIAFLGRSNVGKSSLINLLTGTDIARVSKTPGRTQALNLFEVPLLRKEGAGRGSVIFGDFPGYGFAKVSQQDRRRFARLIDEFLTSRYFGYAVLIVDARHPGLDSDLEAESWLIAQKLPHVIVMNKADKLNRKERADAEKKAQQSFSSPHLLFASTFTKEGKRELEKNLQQVR